MRNENKIANEAMSHLMKVKPAPLNINDLKQIVDSKCTGSHTVQGKVIVFSTLGTTAHHELNKLTKLAHEKAHNRLYKASPNLAVIGTEPGSISKHYNSSDNSLTNRVSLKQLEHNAQKIDLLMNINKATASSSRSLTRQVKPERELISSFVFAASVVSLMEQNKEIASQLIEEFIHLLDKFPKEFEEMFGGNVENIERFLSETFTVTEVSELVEKITNVLEHFPDPNSEFVIELALQAIDKVINEFESAKTPILNDFLQLQLNPEMSPLDLSIGPMRVRDADKERYKQALLDHRPSSELLPDSLLNLEIVNQVIGPVVESVIRKHVENRISMANIIEGELNRLNQKLHEEINQIYLDNVVVTSSDISAPSPYDLPFQPI
ncbi:hypothetical protein [Vibrio alginolyticus]|uniref:hypothetical protein n=1 Tax=Vibrio alginolyticus TaxID=663 RepID=UPI0015949AA6|nr:hypothetical protein [Vibrio alginolyticus]QKS98455.1 hypothetical protein HUO05_24955 [Vibrio alginolyticus]